MEIRQILFPGSTYHICTRSNGDDLLFRDNDDYLYFKQVMHKRLTHAWEIISWVMVPNELHMIVRIKDFESEKPISHPHLLGNVLNGYVQHYNRKYGRQGSLLNRSFRRKLVKNNEELKNVICLVDNLPVARELVSECGDWKYGSYYEFKTSSFASKVAKKVVGKFNDVIDYITHHSGDGLTRFNILPPRSWMNRWSTFEEHLLPAGTDPPLV